MACVQQLVLAAVFCCVIGTEIHPLSLHQIPNTTDNERWGDVVRQIIKSGSSNHTCSSGEEEIVDCINLCASAGPLQRGDCCCHASRDRTSFGQKNGCAYTQLLERQQNDQLFFSSSASSPIGSFNEDCVRIADGSYLEEGRTCDCHLEWRLNQSELEAGTVLPTSSVEPASPSPLPPVLPSPESPSPPVLPSEAAPTPKRSRSPSSTPQPSQTSPSTSPTSTATSSSSSSSSPSVDSTQTPSPQETHNSSSSPDFTPDISDPIETVTPSSSSSLPEQATDSSDDEGSSVCVDERYLAQRGYKPQDFVHQDGPVVPVLCPVIDGLPCGTQHHKLRVNAIDISYKHLCSRKDVQCFANVLKVNSVWSHAWQDVNHAHVVLTMYDVRYPEIAQRLLHRAMSRVRTARLGHV